MEIQFALAILSNKIKDNPVQILKSNKRSPSCNHNLDCFKEIDRQRGDRDTNNV